MAQPQVKKQQTLREWRLDRALTQEQLETLCADTPTAKEKNIHVTQTTISGIEVGDVVNPRWLTVCILAEALGIDPRALRFAPPVPENAAPLPLKQKAS